VPRLPVSHLADVEHVNRSALACASARKRVQGAAVRRYPEKKDVDANYVKCMRERARELPGDRHARSGDDQRREALGEGAGIEKDRFEFKMLLACDATCSSRSSGRTIGCASTPHGEQWYPYLSAASPGPANVAFITGNVVREALRLRR
jgi:hypothetical protein